MILKVPSPLRRIVLHFECAIEDAVRAFAESLPDGARLLDAGAGEGQYKRWFARQRYCGVDLAVGDSAWNYADLDVICDLAVLPLPDAAFDAALNIVTLEHVRDPAGVLREIGRTLRPGAPFLIVVPFEWEVHQEPHDYFRYTRYGLEHLLREAGFGEINVQPVGGYFRLLSRRLLNGGQFFMGSWRWLLFPVAALLLGLPALAICSLDWLDTNKNFTLGYICFARRRS